MNTEFLAGILGAGGAAMVTALVQAYRSIRDGSRLQEKDAFADLEASRSTESLRREWAETERDYWHSRAAALDFAYRSNHGMEGYPPIEPYPKKPKDLDKPRPEEEHSKD